MSRNEEQRNYLNPELLPLHPLQGSWLRPHASPTLRLSFTRIVMPLRRLLVSLSMLFSIATHAAELFPYVMPWDDSAANLTNLSSWNDRPAGRDGFVTVRDGHLQA